MHLLSQDDAIPSDMDGYNPYDFLADPFELPGRPSSSQEQTPVMLGTTRFEVSGPSQTLTGGDDEREELVEVVGRGSGASSQGSSRRTSVKAESSDATSPGSPKRKPRVTLARGGACVNCRNRKLKCSGEKPCKTCRKTGAACQYEEVHRRRPRAILLEERVVELEALLATSGLAVPPSPLHSGSAHSAPGFSPVLDLSHPSARQTVPPRVHPPPVFATTSAYPVAANAQTVDVAPGSVLETSLLNVVLPYTAYLGMPLHTSRFLSLVSLPPNHPSRPHPALLYILFAEAVRILESNSPVPAARRLPPGMFPYAQTPAVTLARVDRARLLGQVSGMSLSLLERARFELNEGIKHVDRPFDLVRAATGIARYLYSLGRFIEGWNVPVARLAVSCGLHRITGDIVPPDPSALEAGVMPSPYASTHFYMQHRSMVAPVRADQPRLRMRPLILPPARDLIDVAERTMTWWAVKEQDWTAAIGWGWVAALNDDECTTPWPWGWGPVQAKQDMSDKQTIRDLFEPNMVRPSTDSSYTLATQSLCLLHRASDLFDRPSNPAPFSSSATLPAFLAECSALESALDTLRSQVPPAFSVPVSLRLGSFEHDPQVAYDGLADPWWIQLHANLFTAEVLLYSELRPHRAGAYERAVSAARALIPLVSRVRPEQWAHVGMVVAIDISLVARFLNKESVRLSVLGQAEPARMAAEDADTLRSALERDFARWMPMAGLHALIVQRVKDGWPEKEGEYERV